MAKLTQCAWDAFLAALITGAWSAAAAIAVAFLPDPGPIARVSLLLSMGIAVFITLRLGRAKGYEDGHMEAMRTIEGEPDEIPF